MDVAFPANRRRIAQHLRDCLDSLHHVALCLRLTVESFQLAEGERRQIGPRPGPEILGGDFGAGDVAQVLVDILRADTPGCAGLV